MHRRGRRSRSSISAAIGAAVLVAMLPGAAAAAGSPPVITADSPAVVVDENYLAQLSGDWSDPDGDAVTVSASLGTVDTEANGRWRWTYPAMDGPFDATVTLTATDETDATASIDVALHVDNVAPTGWMHGPAFVPVHSKSSRRFLWSISDVPGDDPTIDVGCGSGTQTGAGDGLIVGQEWIACTFPTAGPTLVGPQATDKDGASVDARMTTVATTAVRSMADGRLVIDGAAEGDYVGSALAAVDLDDDGRADIAIGTAAPSYDFSFGDPGVISVVRGRADSASLNLGSMSPGTAWTITGPPDVRFGSSLAAAGDVNGDGVGDLLVGSLAGDWVVFGKPGFSSVDVRTMAAARGFAVTGTVVYDPKAQALAGVGDVNGDGFDDIAVGSPAAGSGSGEVAVILGRAVPTNVDASAIPAGRGFRITARAETTGWSLAGADVNGDGRSDVVVASAGGWYSNAIVVYGKAAPVDVDEETMTAAQGFAIGGGEGLEVTAVAAGDMDRDGFADVAVAHGWSGYPDRWAVTIVRGGAANASVPYLATATGKRFVRVHADTSGVPSRLAMADVTGDGRQDLLLGIPFSAGNVGCAFVLRGSATLSDVDLDALDARWSRVDGDLEEALAGGGVAAGDVTGDRIADVIVGAEGATNWSEVDQGRVAVFAGSSIKDSKAPVVSRPTVQIAASGIVHPLVPVRIAWDGSDRTSGIARYQVQAQKDGGPWTGIGGVGTTTVATRSLAAGHVYRFRIRATDGAGNRSDWVYGSSFRLRWHPDGGSHVAYRGAWSVESGAAWTGGSVHSSQVAGARATLTFTGRGVAWVAATGPDRGKARIYVNGVLLRVVDLHATSARSATIVLRKAWSTTATRTIRIVVAGTPGRERIDVDGFIVIR